jgi:hypothetical protein
MRIINEVWDLHLIMIFSLCLVLEENKDVDSATQHEEKKKKKHEYQHQRWI